jgi:hypothetical protein
MRAKLILLVLPLLLVFAPAAFAAQLYINVATGSGGTALPIQKGKIPVATGGNQTVTYTANDGYYLAEVTVNKVAQPLQGRETFTKEFTNVQANQSIAAKFLKDPLITVKGSKGGSITPNVKSVFVPYSTSQSFTFAPQTGYHLDSVVADKVNLGTPEGYTFNYVKTKHALSVKFAINTYSVTTQTGDGGFIAPAGFTAVKHGQSRVFTIKPIAGMQVASVTVNGNPVVGPLPASGPYRLALTITGETVIAATFKEIVLSGTSKLKGTYQLVQDENSFWTETGTSSISEPIAANRITTTFDGNGGCKVSVSGASYTKTMTSTNGSESVNVQANSSPSSCSYTVGEDGAFTLTIGTGDGTETITGWASSDGNVAIIGGFQQATGNGWKEYTVSTTTGVKQGSGITKATAAGTYYLINRDSTMRKSLPQQGGMTSVTDHYSGNRIKIILNAAGSCSVEENGVDFHKETNSGGEFVPTPDTWASTSTACTYTISSNGTFTLTITNQDGTFKANGWSSADGNAIVIGGATQRTESDDTVYSTEHIFGVKAGSGMNVASVNGTYKIVGSDFSFVQHLANGISYVGKVLKGRQINATFDGAGQCTLAYNGEGYYKNMVNGAPVVQVESDTGTMSACSYTVQPDGAFTLNLTGPGGTDTVNGRVSADGSTVLIGGPSQSVDDSNNNHYEVTLLVGTKIK